MAWQDRALCATAFRGVDLWFSEDMKDREDAKEVCRVCPVLAECEAHAVNVYPVAGVWAGKSDRTIRRIRTEKGRA